MKKKYILLGCTLIELAAIAVAIAFDFFIPSLVIIAIGTICLFLRRERFKNLGFRRFKKPLRSLLILTGLTVVWTLVDFGLVLPVLNRVTGMQNLSAYNDIKGNVGKTLFLIGASWTLAAFCEELAFRGFVQNRLLSLFHNQKTGFWIAAMIASAAFGLIHTEQGMTGIIVTAIDAMFFSFVFYKFKSIWAPVYVHGLMNTIGMAVFFFTGPLYALW